MEKQLWLPRNVEQKFRVAGAKDSSRMFLAGDIRANENPVLAATQTLFVRGHNHPAREIAHKFPYYDDERVFQEARKITSQHRVGAGYHLPRVSASNPWTRRVPGA